jgi:hypothetical protein
MAQDIFSIVQPLTSGDSVGSEPWR